MVRKALGFVSGFFSLCCSFFVVAAIGDLVQGDPKHGAGVVAGLLVFFSGLMALTGFTAARLLRSPATTTSTTQEGSTTAMATAGPPVDIALETRVLGLASRAVGRVTAAEVAVACGVGIDAATACLDGLVTRGHAELAVADDGSTVYLVKGFLSAAQKEAAEEVVGVGA
jgi:hypothetical protein